LLDLEAWNDSVSGVNWKEMLADGDDKETLAAPRLNTQTGRPLASDSFLSKLEHTLGRRLRPLPVGRPKKEKSETRKRRK
jgi:putative transposase